MVEQSFYVTADPTPETVEFWLAQLRSPELLIEAADRHPEAARRSPREAVRAALRHDRPAIEAGLDAEQRTERTADRLYWEPRIRELEQLRQTRRTKSRAGRIFPEPSRGNCVRDP